MQEAAQGWVLEHPACNSGNAPLEIPNTFGTAMAWTKELVSGLDIADLAELSWPDQLRLAARTRLLGEVLPKRSQFCLECFDLCRLMFGAHGDGLSWSVFMGEGSVLTSGLERKRAPSSCTLSSTGIDRSRASTGGRLSGLASLGELC